MLRCNLSFINEWDHRWGYHPDSSNHLWAPGPDPATFRETTVQALTVKKNQDQRCWDPQGRDQEVRKTQIKEVKLVVSKEEEASASLPGKESGKQNNGEVLKVLKMAGTEKPSVETNGINEEERTVIWTNPTVFL